MIKVYCTDFLKGSCCYRTRCRYYHLKNICYICNVSTRNVINSSYLKSFCTKCKENDIKVVDYETVFPIEILMLISFYIDEIEDMITLYKSGYFPFINSHEYWTNKIIFQNKEIAYYMVREVVSRKVTFIDMLIYYYYDLPNIRFPKSKTIYGNIMKEYKNIFQRNMLNYKSGKKVKVTYTINTKLEMNDNYIKTFKNYGTSYYDLPRNIKEIDKEILERSNDEIRKHIPDMDTTLLFQCEYIIKNIKYNLITECFHDKDYEGFCEDEECKDDRYYSESLYDADKNSIEEIPKCKKCNYSLIQLSLNEDFDYTCSSCIDIELFY